MKKLIIIGGGFTGTTCARKLENAFSVTLIDHKPYFEFTPSVLRTIVEPDHVKKIQILHKNYLKKAKIVNDEVIEITNKTVKTKAKSYDFDYLIIASGSSYNSPIKEEGLVPATRAKELIECYETLCKSKRILIIGGGLVGVELAAEICTHYKDKKITLVHSHPILMERNSKKSQKYAERFLKKHKVKIIFGERVKEKDKQTKSFVTEKGTRIKADMSFLCVGIKPNYEFIEKNFKKNLSETNQIKVNNFLQMKNSKNIFIGGDVAAIKEEKTAQTAEKHANIIIKNIKNMEENKPLIQYKPRKRPMVISLGKNAGIFESENFVITGFFPSLLKKFVEWKTMIKYR